MKPQLSFSLYTPESSFIKQASVREITAPSIRGRLNILPGHAPLISLLEAGVLSYWLIDATEPKTVAVGWGYLEVKGTEVSVLAETLQTKEALDRVKTEKELKMIKERLSQIDLAPKKRRGLEKARQKLEAELSLYTHRV